MLRCGSRSRCSPLHCLLPGRRSNVVCVPRTHALYPEMERMSTRHSMFLETYYASTTAAGAA